MSDVYRFEITRLLLRLWQREDCRQSILRACGGPKFQAFLGAIYDTLLYQLNDGLSRLVNVRQQEVAKDSEFSVLPLYVCCDVATGCCYCGLLVHFDLWSSADVSPTVL